MKTIVYTCPYVPAAWIAAHGLRPSRVMPGNVGSVFSLAGREGVCPYVRGFIAEVTKNGGAGAVVMTTVCDQMRRAFDIVTRKCDLPVLDIDTTGDFEGEENRTTGRIGAFLEMLQ